MYPNPPHLTVGLYSDQPEVVTFAQMCEVAEEMDCTPLNLVEVAPRDRDFELLSDLGDTKELVGPNAVRASQIVAGQDPRLRALRAGFSHGEFGMVVVQYQLRIGGDLHPVGITLSAMSLGLPERLWTAGERRSAYVIANWTRTALEMAVSRCDALYGAIGVEYSLPTPEQIKNRKGKLTTELFVSRRLLDKKISIERQLRQAFLGGEVVDWTNGIFLSGWAPYNSRRVTLDARGNVTRTAVGLLRAALS